MSTVDSLASWPSDRVLISASALERIAGFVLIPAWIWILVSAALVNGLRARNARARPRVWPGRESMTKPIVIAFVGTAVVLLGVVVVGFVIGADKGSLRIVADGVHQVSTLSVNNANWTAVSSEQYQAWDARFVREDAFFGFFGLAMIGFSLLMLRLHRKDQPASEGLAQRP